MRVTHPTFEDWWDPYTFGVGPAGDYVQSLDEAGRTALEEVARRRFGNGPFTVTATAWAARGTVSWQPLVGSHPDRHGNLHRSPILNKVVKNQPIRGAMMEQATYRELMHRLSEVGAIKRGLARNLPPDLPAGSAAVLTLLTGTGDADERARRAARRRHVGDQPPCRPRRRPRLDRTLPDPADKRSRILRLTPRDAPARRALPADHRAARRPARRLERRGGRTARSGSWPAARQLRRLPPTQQRLHPGAPAATDGKGSQWQRHTSRCAGLTPSTGGGPVRRARPRRRADVAPADHGGALRAAARHVRGDPVVDDRLQRPARDHHRPRRRPVRLHLGRHRRRCSR